MKYRDPQLRELLAAQYALGTLQGRARRRFERLLQSDAALRALVEHWQLRLAPLAHVVPAVPPPPHVWEAIKRRIAAERARAPVRSLPESRSRLWTSLNFWRGLSLAASAVAAMLMIYLAMSPREVQTPEYVAVLADSKAQPNIVINYVPQRGELSINVVALQSANAQQSLELWALPKDAAPRSLGLVSASGKTLIKLPARLTQGLPSIPALAISLEPKGGSPTGAPTGPVLYSGPLLRM